MQTPKMSNTHLLIDRLNPMQLAQHVVIIARPASMFTVEAIQRIATVSQQVVPWLGGCVRVPTRTFYRTSQQCRSIRIHKSHERHGKGYALLVVPLATFCLGTWQVQRRQWKNSLIEELDERTRAIPIPFPEDLAELEHLEYQKVALRGEYDHSRELYVLPRTAVADADRKSGLVGGSGSQSGAHIITPFKVADRELTILVNRGWVPKNRLDPATRQDGQIQGEIDLLGVVRKTEVRKPFAPKNDVQGQRFFHRDVEVMAAMAETDPVFLDADRVTTVPGGPLGGQTRVTLRNEHLSYILTWYTLCAITTFMWVKMYIR